MALPQTAKARGRDKPEVINVVLKRASKVHSGAHLFLQVSQCGGLRRELVTQPTPTRLDWPPAR